MPCHMGQYAGSKAVGLRLLVQTTLLVLQDTEGSHVITASTGKDRVWQVLMITLGWLVLLAVQNSGACVCACSEGEAFAHACTSDHPYGPDKHLFDRR